MKIDAIVGNPPYQVMDGGGAGTSAIPVYNKFWLIALNIKPGYNSMIMPARWYSGGKGLDDFREKMLKDRCLKLLVDFPESRECFPCADIAGGICYALWDKKYFGDCQVITVNNGIRSSCARDLSEFDTFVRQASAIDILHKVTSFKEETFNKNVYSRKPFGLDNNYVGTTKPFDGAITLFGSQGLSYIKPIEVLQNQDLIGKWKVIVSKASAQGGRADKEGKRKVLPKAEVLAPNSACTESYLLISCFDSKQEADNALSYVKTFFFRFLLSLKVITQNIAKESFRFVPLQDFSKPWTDEELYKKYNLTEEEIHFIESMIKPMD